MPPYIAAFIKAAADARRGRAYQARRLSERRGTRARRKRRLAQIASPPRRVGDAPAGALALLLSPSLLPAFSVIRDWPRFFSYLCL